MLAWVLLLTSVAAGAAPLPELIGAMTASRLPEALASIRAASPWTPAPFCWRVRADGGIRQYEPCYSAAPIPGSPLCGLQNLGPTGEWDVAVLDANAAAAAEALATRTQPWGCSWVMLDLENLPPATARAKLPAWVKAFREAWIQVRPEGGVSFAVHPKNGLRDETLAQDWQALCAVADEITVMATDQAYPGVTPMGETAPAAWTQTLVATALARCPVDKIRWGLAAYGYRWPVAEVITERQWVAEGRPGGIPMETEANRQQKRAQLGRMGVRKFFLWALGMEDLAR